MEKPAAAAAAMAALFAISSESCIPFMCPCSGSPVWDAIDAGLWSTAGEGCGGWTGIPCVENAGCRVCDGVGKPVCMCVFILTLLANGASDFESALRRPPCRVGLRLRFGRSEPWSRGAYRSCPVYASAVKSTTTSDRLRLAASKSKVWPPGPPMFEYRSKKSSSWKAGEYRMFAKLLTSSVCALKMLCSVSRWCCTLAQAYRSSLSCCISLERNSADELKTLISPPGPSLL